MLAADTVLQKRYRIVNSLGHGGMGAVYEAIDERFGTPVALKEILIELANSSNELKKNAVVRAFEREAKSLATARHEAIPFVRDYFFELDRQFLVMELIEGEDLAEMLEKRGKPFPLADVVGWADQLLDALDYLHNLKPPIIHRDIKPQNLKVTLRRKIKLLDFGIAKSGDNNSTMTNHTFVGATLNYSPIEQLLRVIAPTFREFIILKHKEEAEKVLAQNTDERCDIYALGATFYHLLTNHLPIDSTKRTLELWEGKADPLPNPSELNHEIPPSISACLLKAMEIKRENRYSTAIEMQKVLQTLMTDERRDSADKILQPDSLPDNLEKHRSIQLGIGNFAGQDKITFRTDDEIITEDRIAPPADKQRRAAETFVTASSVIKLPDTIPVETIPKLESPVINDFDKLPGGSKQPTPDMKLSWILPIAAVGILSVGGIGGMMWLNNADSANTNKSGVNSAVIVAPTDAAVSPTITPNNSPGVLPATSPLPTISNIEKPKQSVTTPGKTPPKQNPVKTSTPEKIKTPKPEKTISEDCRYNGKCN